MRDRRLTPLPSTYAGHRFRSRLECRWAIFFDALKFRWQYEPEAFKATTGGYCPDFLLGSKTWVEVKPDRDLTEAETVKAVGFARDLGDAGNYVIIRGRPWPGYYSVAVVHDGAVAYTDLRWADCPLCGTVTLGVVRSDDGLESWMECRTCAAAPKRTWECRVEGRRVYVLGDGFTSRKLDAAFNAATSYTFG